MDFLPKNIRYIDGAYWLVKFRWFFIVCLVAAAFCARNIFQIAIEEISFYVIAIALVFENLISLFFLRRARNNDVKNITRLVTRVINFQISTDLLFLFIIIHYSGGIENPIYIFCVFHMVISSILITRIDSIMQTALALSLLWLLAYLEYAHIIPHYNMWLSGQLKRHLYDDLPYVVQSLTIFTLASFMLVYMANHIVGLLRKQERAYRKANAMLEQHDKIKDEYILRVTHNIKGHLTIIQTNLALITEKMLGYVNPKQLEFIEGAFNRTIKLTSFVNELLKLTQTRLNDEMDIETFSLKELALNVYESSKKTADLKNISLNCHIDDSIDIITSGQTPVEEVILNLVENAIKYTPENGKVEMFVRDKKENVIIEVTDSGIGIPAADLPKLFTEFFRASNAKKIIKDGNGLGLAMVKYIAQRYGGDVTVMSKEGIGSTFTVTLPKNFSARKISRKAIDQVLKG